MELSKYRIVISKCCGFVLDITLVPHAVDFWGVPAKCPQCRYYPRDIKMLWGWGQLRVPLVELKRPWAISLGRL